MREEKLSNVTVESISSLIVQTPALVTPETSIETMLRHVIQDTRSRHAYVVDADNRLIGSVRFNNIIQYLFPSTILLELDDTPKISSFMEYSDATHVRQIMNTRPRYVQKSTPLAAMVRIMMEEKINELPVVDEQMHVIGEVNVLEIIAFALQDVQA
jgi:Mg/Co/Ni transporter MgtE